MEVDDKASPVPVDPAPPEQPKVDIWELKDGSSSGGSVQDIAEFDESLDHSGLAEGEEPELQELVQPSDTSIISEASNYSLRAEPAASREGSVESDDTTRVMDVFETKVDLRTVKKRSREPEPEPQEPGIARQEDSESPEKRMAQRVEEAEESMEKEDELDEFGLEEEQLEEELVDPDEPAPEEYDSSDIERIDLEEEEQEELEQEEFEPPRRQEVDRWWDKTDEEIEEDLKELDEWVEAGGNVEISDMEREQIRAFVHHYYPFPLSTLDEPDRKFTVEEQMVKYEDLGPEYKGVLKNPPEKVLKLNLRIIKNPKPPCTQADLDTMKPIAQDSPVYCLHCLVVTPKMHVRELIREIRKRMKLDRQTLVVHVFSKGRQLDKWKTMMEVAKQQEREESLEEENGKFFLDVQIFERYERPPLIMQTGPNTYRLLRRRARSAPPLDDVLENNEESEEESEGESEEEDEKGDEETQSEQVPQLEEQISAEEEEQEELDTSEPAETTPSTSTPMAPPQFISPAEPIDEDDDDGEEMPSLSAEEPMQTEQLPQHNEPPPMQPQPTFQFPAHQSYEDYRHMLRERERIRRRGPRAPRENVSTTYHELTPPAPRYPNGYPFRPPVAPFRFEGPVPFDAKVTVLSNEFKRSPEEIRRMSPEEVDRLFNQIATSHIAKNQQLQHQQEQLFHAQNMHMRQSQGMPRVSLPLPVRLGNLPPGHHDNRPNIRLPPGVSTSIVNRLVPVMMPITPGAAPSGSIPRQMMQQMISQHQAALMAARFAQRQREEAARSSQPSTSAAPVAHGPSTSSAPIPPVPFTSTVAPVVRSEETVRPSPEVAEKPSRAEKRKRPSYSRTPYMGPSNDTETRNHFVSVVSPYHAPGQSVPWMHHPVNRNGAINVPNTIRALTEFIELCESQNADPSRFLESYYLAEQSPKYRQMLNCVDHNMHVVRRRCDLGDVRIPHLDAEKQLRLYVMRFEADEQDDKKWAEFYEMMEWPLPPDGRYPKGKKIDARGHLSVNLTQRAPRMRVSQPMRPEEEEILKRAIKAAEAGQLAEQQSAKAREKSPEGKKKSKPSQKRNSIQMEPEPSVPNAEFLQSLAPSLHIVESPESFGEEEHSQTSSDVTSSDGVRPSSNSSSNAQEDSTNNAGNGEEVQSSSAAVVASKN